MLQPGDDMLDLARDAIDRGADVIGMAGGDGSQALVASIAAERGVPMVVIPAGTRNHLALDLGIDRDDVVGALDAFDAAVERPDGPRRGERSRVREQRLARALRRDRPIARVPRREGGHDAVGAPADCSAPARSRWTCASMGPDGTHHDGAHVVQVSNGPYGTTLATITGRPRIDTGKLGIITLVLPDDAATRRFLTALATNRPDRYEGLQIWSGGEFVIDSGGAIAVGLDGEAMDMDPPLRFSIRPHALRVRLAHDAIGYSPAARTASARDFLPNLWNVALGRPVAIGS